MVALHVCLIHILDLHLTTTAVLLCDYASCPAGVLFFVQLLPAAITCFEYHKFLQEVRLA
jgi:hypothetical protein